MGDTLRRFGGKKSISIRCRWEDVQALGCGGLDPRWRQRPGGRTNFVWLLVFGMGCIQGEGVFDQR